VLRRGRATISRVTGEGPKQRYSRREARRLLNLTERRLKRWEEQGLIEPAAEYDFVDLVALRTIAKLQQGGARAPRIRRALEAIREKLKGVENPLVELRVFTEGRKVCVQVGNQTMEPVSGQLLLDFGRDEMRRLVSFPVAEAQRSGAARRSGEALRAEALFQRGVELEGAGDVEGAIEAYEAVIAADPGFAGAYVNLGTIYFTARDLKKAEHYYRRAVEADGAYALAHFNLGNLYEELGKRADALVEYQLALKCNPQYADAHYNIALLYQSSGQPLKAVRHWKAYLKLDPGSPWAVIARRELDRIYRETILKNS